jgi:hypothetical protein
MSPKIIYEIHPTEFKIQDTDTSNSLVPAFTLYNLENNILVDICTIKHPDLTEDIYIATGLDQRCFFCEGSVKLNRSGQSDRTVYYSFIITQGVSGDLNIFGTRIPLKDYNPVYKPLTLDYSLGNGTWEEIFKQ